jgi:hypothetical protein
MNIELTREFLLWCTIINFGILMVWWLFFVVARDWMHRFHGKCRNHSVQPGALGGAIHHRLKRGAL